MKTCGMFAAGFSLLLTLPIAGCGGGNSNTGAFTQTQAQIATSDIFEAFAASAESAGYARSGIGHAEVAGIRNAHPSDSPIEPSLGDPRLVPASPLAATTIPTYTYACPLGGTIVVNGSYSGTTTSETINIVETINSCMDSGITMNGSPNVDLTGTFTDSGTVTTGTVAIVGGFTSGRDNCSVNVTITATVNDTSGSVTETVSGSVCGVALNGTYSD